MTSPKQQVGIDLTDNLINLAITEKMAFATISQFATWIAVSVNHIVFLGQPPGLANEYAQAYLLGVDWVELAQEYVNDNPTLIKGVQNARTL